DHGRDRMGRATPDVAQDQPAPPNLSPSRTNDDRLHRCSVEPRTSAAAGELVTRTGTRHLHAPRRRPGPPGVHPPERPTRTLRRAAHRSNTGAISNTTRGGCTAHHVRGVRE